MSKETYKGFESKELSLEGLRKIVDEQEKRLKWSMRTKKKKGWAPAWGWENQAK